LPKRSFASGDIAIDKLPIPPDLASGEIIINGTAVLCNLSFGGCAVKGIATKIKNTNKALDTGPMKIINAKYQTQVVIFNPYLIICETSDSNLRESVSLRETASLCNWNLSDFL
jgi:hypothetical protein